MPVSNYNTYLWFSWVIDSKYSKYKEQESKCCSSLHLNHKSPGVHHDKHDLNLIYYYETKKWTDQYYVVVINNRHKC